LAGFEVGRRKSGKRAVLQFLEQKLTYFPPKKIPFRRIEGRIMDHLRLRLGFVCAAVTTVPETEALPVKNFCGGAAATVH
jgi:hypothetical protein